MSENTEFTISGYASLDDIENRIREKESVGYRFKQSRILNGTNIVMFEKMPYGERPRPDVVFREGQAPSGDGMQLLWKGAVATSKGSLTVSAYR